MMDDADLTDHHGEAEALRRENARLRKQRDDAEARYTRVCGMLERTHVRAEAAEAALAASRAPDPVVNDVSCPPDWKAMAERLGEALGLLAIATGMQDAGGKVRAALSDLAKMKGE